MCRERYCTTEMSHKVMSDVLEARIKIRIVHLGDVKTAHVVRSTSE